MHLYVSVPTHSGSVAAETALTLIGVQELASQRGLTTSFRFVSGAVIAEVRNVIAAHFLKSGADLLLMIDSDQSFEKDLLGRMIDFGQPLVGCIYPKRKYEWSNVNLRTATNVENLLYQASDYVGKLEFDAEGSAQIVGGFAKALHIGTGIFLLRRHVLEAMIGRYPELKSRGFHDSDYPGVDEHNWGFFNHIEMPGECSLSEDISFCRRWREAGGEIWSDVTRNTAHIGRHAFSGNYLDYLVARGEITQSTDAGGIPSA